MSLCRDSASQSCLKRMAKIPRNGLLVLQWLQAWSHKARVLQGLLIEAEVAYKSASLAIANCCVNSILRSTCSDQQIDCTVRGVSCFRTVGKLQQAVRVMRECPEATRLL